MSKHCKCDILSHSNSSSKTEFKNEHKGEHRCTAFAIKCRVAYELGAKAESIVSITKNNHIDLYLLVEKTSTVCEVKYTSYKVIQDGSALKTACWCECALVLLANSLD